MALLREQVDAAFDARCVKALDDVLRSELGDEDELARARENAAAHARTAPRKPRPHSRRELGPAA